MATTWPQGVQPQTHNNGPQYSSTAPPPRKNTNPPPVCFNCGEAHFIIECPQGQRPAPGSFPQPAPAFQQYPGPAPPAQAYPSQVALPPSQYPPYQPNQQYGPPGPQPTYNQPPQPYSAPPTPQYSRPGYQPPPYNQYPQPTGPPQYSSLGYQAPSQQYGPPAPAPYQPPNPYAQPTASYGGIQQKPPTPYQVHPSQWNAPPPARPPLQQPRRSNSFQLRDLSATPSQQSQPQQLDYGSEGPQKTPQTPASNHGGNQQGAGARQGSQSSPATIAAESKIPGTVSTPHNHPALNIGLVRKESTHGSVASESKEGEDSVKVESETPTAEEDDDTLFDWDCKYIFKEPERNETVALAQPLSANFKSTPVPLVQAWSIHIPSISRYARKDNIKEFMRSIRNAPQWSFLQEDPGFSDAPLDGPLIPFSEVPAWMEARHRRNATPESELEPELEPQNEEVPESRKRLRSEEPEEGQIDELDDVDNQIALEASELEGPPVKRQKNEENEEDVVMGTPRSRTPVLGNGRDGTPCLPTDDDAWAPEPGECAASPMDPTEALLASLGVSGAPKPVKQESLPPYLAAATEDNESPQTKQSQTPVGNQQSPNGPPPNVAQSNGPPMNNAFANSPQYKPQWGPPANASYENGPPANAPYANGPPTNGPPPNGLPPNGLPLNPAYGTPQYAPPANAPYGNGPPYAAAVNPQYGPPVNAPYGPPNGYPQGPPQPYGPPRPPAYGSAPPYNGPQGYPQQYGPSANYQQGPPQYGQPPAHYGPSNNFPQGPPQYQPQVNPSFGNGVPVPGTYGGVPQSSPVSYGPPQAVPYNGYPNPLQQYGSNGPQGPYGNGPQANAPYPNGSSVQLPYSNAPLRQDSGYVSARGSYSNGSGPFDFAQQNSPQNPSQQTPQNDSSRPAQGFGSSQKENNQPQQSDRRNSAEQGGADTTDSTETNANGESGNTPLSPTSAEILGKLVRKDSSGDGSRPKGETARKMKRPQPVVADAYSRRW